MSTTRESGAQVGNGLKTIYSRITTMKPAADSLATIGISINDLEGNVKPVNTILGELSEQWNGLSDAQRQNIGVSKVAV